MFFEGSLFLSSDSITHGQHLKAPKNKYEVSIETSNY